MSGLVELLRAAKESGDPGPLLSAIPYAGFLGLSAELEEGRLVARLSFSEALIGNPALPALHGGTIGALLETAAILQLFWAAEPVILPKTITLTIDYLRSAGPMDARARAELVRVGRRVATVRAEAWQDDPARPVATANVHLLLEPSS